MSEEWRVMLSVDESMTAFLRDHASKVNERYYKKLLAFVMLYRDCLK
jgi:hypothetical protein